MNYYHQPDSNLPHNDRFCQDMPNHHVGETFTNISSNSHEHEYNRFTSTRNLNTYPENNQVYTSNRIEHNPIYDPNNRNDLNNLNDRTEQIRSNNRDQLYDYEMIKFQDPIRSNFNLSFINSCPINGSCNSFNSSNYLISPSGTPSVNISSNSDMSMSCSLTNNSSTSGSDFSNSCQAPNSLQSTFISSSMDVSKDELQSETPINLKPLSGLNDGLPYQIRIFGIPPCGGKSRVETQIKLCLQLVTPNGTKVSKFSRLRLPDILIANERWRRHGSKGGVDLVSIRDGPSDAKHLHLWLHGTVVCASQPFKTVNVCSGCVIRETKRAQRKKVVSNLSSNSRSFPGHSGERRLPPSPPASTTGSPRRDALFPSSDPTYNQSNSKIQMNENKVLLINCPPVMDFSSSDVILPTRIPCYCRHHREKVGFRLVFEMRDDHGHLVARGISHPILITDDHKSVNKLKKQQDQQQQFTKDVITSTITAAVPDGNFNANAPNISNHQLIHPSVSNPIGIPHKSPVIMNGNMDTFGLAPIESSRANKKRRPNEINGTATASSISPLQSPSFAHNQPHNQYSGTFDRNSACLPQYPLAAPPVPAQHPVHGTCYDTNDPVQQILHTDQQFFRNRYDNLQVTPSNQNVPYPQYHSCSRHPQSPPCTHTQNTLPPLPFIPQQSSHQFCNPNGSNGIMTGNGFMFPQNDANGHY